MMHSQIMGNVGSEPEVRYTEAGRPVTSVGIAVHTGQDTPPIWWDCTIWGEEAIRFAERINKGDRLFLGGLLQLAMRKNSTTEQLEMKPKLNVKTYQVVARSRNAQQEAAPPADDLPPVDAYEMHAARSDAQDDDDIPF